MAYSLLTPLPSSPLQERTRQAYLDRQQDVKKLQGYMAMAEAAFQAKEADYKGARQQLAETQARGGACPWVLALRLAGALLGR